MIMCDYRPLLFTVSTNHTYDNIPLHYLPIYIILNMDISWYAWSSGLSSTNQIVKNGKPKSIKVEKSLQRLQDTTRLLTMMGTKKSNVASYISNILYSNSVRRREIY